MLRQILTHINDVEIYPVISLLLFFSIFSIMLIRVIRMDKGKVHRAEMLPLEEDDTVSDNSNNEIK